MKNILLFVFALALTTYTQAQTYVPFPETACWNYSKSAGESVEYTSIIMEGDTLMDNNNYHKVYGYILIECCPEWNPFLNSWVSSGIYGCINRAYLGAFREDTAKNIWFRSNLANQYNYNLCGPFLCNISTNDSTDILLYKFDLAIGDTLPIYNRLTTQPYIVDAIDSVDIGGYRKRYKIKNVQNFNNGNDDYWIEGIGSYTHLFHSILIGSTSPLTEADSCYYFSEEFASYLTCYSAIAGDCPINTNIRPITTTNHLVATPNPFNEQLTISYLGDWQANIELSISSVQGTLVAQQKIAATNQFSHTFDLANLPAGIYLVFATSNKGVWVQKVIK